MNRLSLLMGLGLELEPEQEVNTERSFGPNANESSQNTQSRQIKALVVDDVNLHLRLTTRFLSRVGIHADTAANGEQALQRFRYRAYNLVLLDLNMPRMDGFKTARKILELPLAERPFLVACSASLALNARERCLSEGMDAYLPKPIHPEDLLDVLDQFKESRKFRGDFKHRNQLS